jgi:hypothetical protein
VITPTQPKVPEAKVRGSHERFQCLLVSPERVPGVREGLQRSPPGPLELAALYGDGQQRRGERPVEHRVGHRDQLRAWEKKFLSAREFKRVGRHSEYAITTVWGCIIRDLGDQVNFLKPKPRICFSPLRATGQHHSPVRCRRVGNLHRADGPRGVARQRVDGDERGAGGIQRGDQRVGAVAVRRWAAGDLG